MRHFKTFSVKYEDQTLQLAPLCYFGNIEVAIVLVVKFQIKISKSEKLSFISTFIFCKDYSNLKSD